MVNVEIMITEITTVIMADVKMIITIMALVIMGIVETDNFLEG